MNILFLLRKKKYYDPITCQFFLVCTYSLLNVRKISNGNTIRQCKMNMIRIERRKINGLSFDSMIHSDIIQSV